MNDKTNWRILITDIAWPSIEPEVEVLTRVGGELILANSGREEELLRLVSTADAIQRSNHRKNPTTVMGNEKIG